MAIILSHCPSGETWNTFSIPYKYCLIFKQCLVGKYSLIAGFFYWLFCLFVLSLNMSSIPHKMKVVNMPWFYLPLKQCFFLLKDLYHNYMFLWARWTFEEKFLKLKVELCDYVNNKINLISNLDIRLRLVTWLPVLMIFLLKIQKITENPHNCTLLQIMWNQMGHLYSEEWQVWHLMLLSGYLQS